MCRIMSITFNPHLRTVGTIMSEKPKAQRDQMAAEVTQLIQRRDKIGTRGILTLESSLLPVVHPAFPEAAGESAGAHPWQGQTGTWGQTASVSPALLAGHPFCGESLPWALSVKDGS